MQSGKDTGKEKGTIGENERTEVKKEKRNEKAKNETLKGKRNNERTRTERKKTTEGSSKLSGRDRSFPSSK